MSSSRPLVAPNDLELRRWSHPDEDTWHIQFPWAKNPLSMNGSRGHRMASFQAEKAARDEAHMLIRNFARVPALGRCRALVTWWVEVKRTRDLDNLARLEKRLFDAIVLAGVVPDDAPEFMEKPRGEIRHVDDSAGLVTSASFTLTISRLAEPDPRKDA